MYSTLLTFSILGAVYKVRASTDRKEHAMKVEFRSARDSKLKMEIAILKLVNEQADSRRQNHYTRIIDRGKNEQFQFVVMQLVGKSLDDLKANRHNKVFSPGTAFGVGLQCLEALEQLHKQAYIHRDIKPANYAKGLDNEARIVSELLLCRKYEGLTVISYGRSRRNRYVGMGRPHA